MATGERIERGHLETLLRQTLLVPEIVEAILDLPQQLGPIPMDWAAQRQALAKADYRHPGSQHHIG